MTKQPFALGRFARLVGEPRARGKCQPNGASCRGQSATGEREAGDFPLSLSWALPKGQYKVLTFFPHLLIPAASTAPHHASSMVLYRFRSLPSRRWTIYPLLSLLITWFPQVYRFFIGLSFNLEIFRFACTSKLVPLVCDMTTLFRFPFGRHILPGRPYVAFDLGWFRDQPPLALPPQQPRLSRRLALAFPCNHLLVFVVFIAILV